MKVQEDITHPSERTKTLVLYTNSFPFEETELSFILPELNIVSQYFSKVYIIAKSSGSVVCQLPQNCEPISFENILEKGDSLSVKSNVTSLLRAQVAQVGLRSLVHFRYLRAYFNGIIDEASALHHYLKEQELLGMNTTHYSYWMSDWATLISLIKPQGFKITRAHGFDLYNERSQFGFQLLRDFQIQNLDFIASISNLGKSYLKDSQGAPEHMIGIHHMGIQSFKSGSLKDEKFHILSCSSAIPLKRLDLILRLLAKTGLELLWTHVGDGPELPKIKSLARDESSAKIEFNFLGRLSQDELRDLYESSFFDLFINLSETEGVPVSIMEAISAGVPVLACNVGAVSEVVPDSDLLLEKDFDLDFAVTKLKQVLSSGYTRDKKTRSNVQDFWAQHFDPAQNYHSFAQTLSKHSSET